MVGEEGDEPKPSPAEVGFLGGAWVVSALGLDGSDGVCDLTVNWVLTEKWSRGV